jgi:CheY-like chemotaxis protein
MPHRILVVDDEPDCREATVRYLKRAGYDVHCASGGREAVALIGTPAPDAIILDYRMPEMDGVAVLEVFRSYLNWADVPVIMITAYADEPRLWHVADHGVRHIVPKSDGYLEKLAACLTALLSIPAPEADRSQFPQSESY